MASSIEVPAFTRSPIMQAELRFQQRPAARRWWRLLVRAALLAALMLALILYGGELAGALLQRDPTPIGESLGIGVPLLIVLTGALHFGLMFRALAQGANSIAREQQGHTWDTLVLTGIDARQIVLGKWWATVRRLWRLYLLLAVLRAGVIVWMAASASRIFMTMVVTSSGTIGDYDIGVPSPLYLALAAGIVVALTVANAAFTAAVGVMASSGARSPVGALVWAIFMRAALLVTAAFLLAWLSGLIAIGFRAESEFPSRVATVLLDNGLSLAGELAVYRSAFYGMANADFVLPAALLSLAAYGLLTWAALELAQQRVVRLRALPPARTRLS